MSPYRDFDANAWQESWDRQQEAFMPDREERFRSLLDTVDAVTHGERPRILDLAGGTGSITLRALRRFPDARTTVLDVDPVLQTIARASLGVRAMVVTADLRTPDWVDALPERDFDAVLTATALHWLPPERLTVLYGEIREVLRPGGVFVNVEGMADDGLPGLTQKLLDHARVRREARYAAGAVLSWDAWWDHVAKDPTLGPLLPRRRELFVDRHHGDWSPPMSWHLDTLRQAGYAEVGITWRNAYSAAATAVR
jgi:trans-aconitate methyltransferase